VDKTFDRLNSVITQYINTTLIGKDIYNLDPYSLFRSIYKWDGLIDLGTAGFMLLKKIDDIFTSLYEHYSYENDEGVQDIKKDIKNLEKKLNTNKTGIIAQIWDNLNIITPGFTGSPLHTPLWTFDSALPGINKPLSEITAKSLFKEWLYASYMLIHEQNILQKAKKYLENKYSDKPITLSKEYLECYLKWRARQLYFRDDRVEQDFSVDIVLYREICEDLLYVQLNILLAIRVCNYLNNTYKDNVDSDLAKLIIDMSDILNTHISTYAEAYSCLQEIRLYRFNKYSDWQLGLYYKEVIYSFLEEKKDNIADIEKCLLK